MSFAMPMRLAISATSLRPAKALWIDCACSSSSSKDVSLAARNALLEMIDYMTETYGLTREQAYVLASVAVDLRIGQLVDAPNVGVTAILPLDILEGRRR